MSRKRRGVPKDVGVRLSPPELWELSFIRNKTSVEVEPSEPRFDFELGVSRLGANRLGVELAVKLRDFPPISMRIGYRAVCETDFEGSAEEFDLHLRLLAAEVVPAALYPYVRETAGTTALKAGFPQLLPPLISFAEIFDPKRIELPSTFAEDASADLTSRKAPRS